MATTGSPAPGITAVRVGGFKSLRDPVDLAIRPLTLLAGQNSAGKSSVMQALLLAKQTLEAPYDPGVLLLDGPCVHAATAESLLWRGKEGRAESWTLGVVYSGISFFAEYGRKNGGGFELRGTTMGEGASAISVRTPDDDVPTVIKDYLSTLIIESGVQHSAFKVSSARVSHRLEAALTLGAETRQNVNVLPFFPTIAVEDLIHVPGLRGLPARSYPVTRVADRYPGLFSDYTASVLFHWQQTAPETAAGVADDLRHLGITSAVRASRIAGNDSAVEVTVGRLPASAETDMVNIADVGFGASQVLPVVVALRAARPGQLVHIEQPELHLHPNAQVAMAALLVNAAKRGARVVVETHSSVLLKAVQLAVARGDLPPEDVALHWFTRDDDGATQVRTADLDRTGVYGDWPVDFASVEMDVDAAFVQASFEAEE